MTGKTTKPHKWRKALLVSLALVLLCSAVFAAEIENVSDPQPNFKGDLSVKLNATEFSAGDTVKAAINLLNLDDSPLYDADAIVEIVKGADFYYPSQSSDADNVFFEKKISGINIAPHYNKRVEFEYALPKDISPGDYRLDVYFRNGRAPIVGMVHLFAAPKSTRFTVNGNGSFPQAKILRTKTEFHHQPGPVGPGIGAGQEIKSSVFIENSSAQEMKGLELRVGICDWDDTACEKFIEEKTIQVKSVGAGKTADVNVSLNAPELPSAYAIRLELVGSDGRTQSIYRNRSVVLGPTAKIRKVLLNGYYFSKDENVELSYLVGPSPDHYTLPAPVFENFSLSISVKDERTGKTVFAQDRAFDKIAIPEFKSTKFSFAPETALDYFTVCSRIEKDMKVFDEYCFTINPKAFDAPPEKNRLLANWAYDGQSSNLSIEFSNENPNVADVNAYYFVLGNTQDDFGSGFVSGKSPQNASLRISPGQYTLFVNNLNERGQESFNLDLSEKGFAKTCAENNGNACAQNEYCQAKTIAASDESECCLARCVPSAKSGPSSEEGGAVNLPAIAAVAVAIIIIAGAAYFLLKKRKGGKDRTLADYAEKFDKPLRSEDLEL